MNSNIQTPSLDTYCQLRHPTGRLCSLLHLKRGGPNPGHHQQAAFRLNRSLGRGSILSFFHPWELLVSQEFHPCCILSHGPTTAETTTLSFTARLSFLLSSLSLLLSSLPQMVVQIITLHALSKSESGSPKLELRWSIGHRLPTPTLLSTATTPSYSRRWSQLHDRSRCIARQTFQPLYQPAMEATKELARKWSRRASLRNLKRKKSTNPAEQQSQSAAPEYRSQPAHNAYGQKEEKGAQTTIAASLEGDREKHSDTSSDIRDIPATVSLPVAGARADPPFNAPANPANPANEAGSPTASSAPDAPFDLSPGSEVSPTSRPPPHPAGEENDADIDAGAGQFPTKPLVVDYFTLQQLNGPNDAPPKADDANGDDHAQGQVRRQDQNPNARENSDTPLSSAAPSLLLSPRESLLVDDGRSSIASLNGSGGRSRHSSVNSPLTYQLSNGHLPRSKTSPNSRDRNPSPLVISRYVPGRTVPSRRLLAQSWSCCAVLFGLVSLRRSFSSPIPRDVETSRSSGQMPLVEYINSTSPGRQFEQCRTTKFERVHGSCRRQDRTELFEPAFWGLVAPKLPPPLLA